MRYNIIILVCMASVVLIACKRKSDMNMITKNSNSLSLTSVADSIIYDVFIKNSNPDDEWAEACIQSLDRETLIDLIFEAVLSGKIIAYDNFTEEVYSCKRIKDLLKDDEFSKDRIGQIQFTEKWYFDSETFHMRKQVNSIVLGYEIYNEKGAIKGYKAAFKINLNNPF